MSKAKEVRVKPIEWDDERPGTSFGYIGNQRVAIATAERKPAAGGHHVRATCLIATSGGTRHFGSLEEAKAGAEVLVRKFLAQFVDGL